MRVPHEILIGGNHLATILIGYGLPVEGQDSTYEEVLNKRGQPYADIWVCWSAIMRCRDRVAQ
jgi:hypothetical protein